MEPRYPVLEAESLLSEPPGKPKNTGVGSLSLLHNILHFNLKIFWSFPAIFLFLISSLIHFEVRIYLDFSFTLPVPSGVSYDP